MPIKGNLLKKTFLSPCPGIQLSPIIECELLTRV